MQMQMQMQSAEGSSFFLLQLAFASTASEMVSVHGCCLLGRASFDLPKPNWPPNVNLHGC
jgi:hypothetical protein